MKKVILIITVFLLMYTSCKEENIKYTYYKNGKIREKTDVDNNMAYSYYKSGKVKFIAGIKGEKLHGRFIEFYENGIIEDSGYYNNDNQFGTWYYFNQLGKLDKVCNYAYVADDGNVLNEIVYFDKNGDTIRGKGQSYRIETHQDTINKKDTFKFDIIIEQSVFNDSIGVLIANFDSIYNLKDSNNIVRFEAKNYIIKCYRKGNKTGKNIVRGVIFDHTIRNDSDLYRELYFSKDFFVKPK